MNAPETIPTAAPQSRAGAEPLLAPCLLPALGPRFAVPVAPQPLPGVHWVARNQPLAAELGVAGWLQTDDALAVLAGNRVWPNADGPWASVYSGHQFGAWAGQLGDGRALLLGERATPAGPMELQLKGSGLTPFSRMGDGRAVLRSSIREYLCSEAMHGLGIPTTRSLALVGSPRPVRRETIETAAVVTRVAPSFLRFGHFEHFTHSAADVDALRTLADAAIARDFPALVGAAQPYAALLDEVARRTARLVAQWQAVGFAHGVLNTDNCSLLGLTIDYGPFAFLDAFDPGLITNHSDSGGRYVYARQPQVMFWNLHALAHALMPLVGSEDAARDAIEGYAEAYTHAMLERWRAKLGLRTADEADRALADDWLRLMAAHGTDFTIAWRTLARFDSAAGARNDALRDLFVDREAFDAWAARYAARLRAEASDDAERAARMQRVNPKFVLRNHLAETAIRAARDGDFSEVARLQALLERPFDEQPEHEADAGFPPDWARSIEVSCSS